MQGNHRIGQMRRKWPHFHVLLSLFCLGTGCKTAVSTGPSDPAYLPFLKNSPNECYYLDEFMPIPDGLVAGKSGTLDLRYYSYKLANYKEWRGKEIMLSFYSKNGHCWSLFEEYYVTDN